MEEAVEGRVTVGLLRQRAQDIVVVIHPRQVGTYKEFYVVCQEQD